MGGVADDADDAHGAAGVVAVDPPLGVGPLVAAVAAADPEVGAVLRAAVLERLGDEGVEAAALVRQDPRAERLGTVVVLRAVEVEDVEGGVVHEHRAVDEVPVESAHPEDGAEFGQYPRSGALLVRGSAPLGRLPSPLPAFMGPR